MDRLSKEFFFVGLILFLYMHAWFIASVLPHRSDLADTAWGIGFILASWAAFVISNVSGWRGALSATLVTIWGARLAWHIHRRNRNKPEDYRYQAWRKAWGRWFLLRSYGQVFILQGLLLFLVVIPVLLVNFQPSRNFSLLDAAGLVLWAFGFLFEALGDWQLAAFIAEPANAGKLMQGGLWRYSRHPNYFGDACAWWGIAIVALQSNMGWLGLVGSGLMSFLLVRVSGVPMLEKTMHKRRPDYVAYQERTSGFIPRKTKNS